MPTIPLFSCSKPQEASKPVNRLLIGAPAKLHVVMPLCLLNMSMTFVAQVPCGHAHAQST